MQYRDGGPGSGPQEGGGNKAKLPSMQERRAGHSFAKWQKMSIEQRREALAQQKQQSGEDTADEVTVCDSIPAMNKRNREFWSKG